jgi:primosomal protein N' (replication factor Y) (superfamily II helicase)
MRLIRVAVPVPIDDTFVYEFPGDEIPEPGLRVLVPFGRRQLWGTVMAEELVRPARAILPIAGIPEPRLTLTPELIDLCRWVADYYAAPLGEVLHAAAPSPTALKRRATAESPEEERGWHASAPPARTELNEDQAAALDVLERSLGERAFQPFLLHGVTGSGKTAVYMHAALTAIRQRGQALILVPEIALSPQALDSFRQGGIERVALYHSTLRPRERADVWRRAAEGSLDLVVGTRSAVFLPFRDLRLIAVDEEQDGAYKQEDSPRYHARDVALVRAKRLGATLVLASATPSLESYAKAASGATTLLRLPRRVDGRPLATVRVADLRIRARPGASAGREASPPETRREATASWAGEAPPATPSSAYLTPALLTAMERTLVRGEQGILFLNRRGHSTVLQCRGCGSVAACTRCDVSLTVHAEDQTLRCHYCGAVRRLLHSCRECGASDLWLGGVGIQKIEREVARLFPHARIARLDLDAVRRRGAAGAILRSFRQGDTDFLLGTQMVTKGFDFPGVTLVGIIVADLQLFLPDFRAAERTFQLLTQVAGRAGRGKSPGEVIMQSYNPDHPALRCAADQDYEAFFALESAERRELGYPPYGHLVEIEVRGAVLERVVDGVQRVRKALARIEPGVEILGPAPKAISRIQGKERWHLLLRSNSRKSLREHLKRAIPALRSMKLPGVLVAVDVDPRQLL